MQVRIGFNYNACGPMYRYDISSASTATRLTRLNLFLSLAGSDYITTAVEFIFEARTANQLLCVNIPIVDDDVYEQNEVMLIFLSTPDMAVQLDPQYAFITILDDDGM